jgi:glycosyltransferase involved in cell wall biosynthesis
MNITIDGRWNGDTGIGRLYREITSRTPEDVNLHIINSGFPLGHPFSPFHLGKELKASLGDVFYSPSFMPPLKSKIPFVITIHDLNHLYYYSRFHKLYLKYIIAYLGSKSKKIITVSNYTKTEIVNKLKIDARQIDVVYNGIDDSFKSNKEALSLGRPFFLYIGNRRSYKNITRMLHAFSNANIPRDYILALSGVIDDELAKEINLLGIRERVKFLGHITELDLPMVYKGAYALLFVSLMEGFGLPVIEAMASGTPVITSNITSMPEIAGDAALLVNPLDVKTISNAIEEIINSKELYQNKAILGLERSLAFNWDDCARQTWDAILK